MDSVKKEIKKEILLEIDNRLRDRVPKRYGEYIATRMLEPEAMNPEHPYHKEFCREFTVIATEVLNEP